MGRGKDSGARPDWSALSNPAGSPRATMSRMSDATVSAAALPSHLARAALHNEVHARPPEPIEAPVAISYLLMVTEPAARTASREHLAQLLKDHHLPEAGEGATHLRADLGRFRLRWERHTEFVSWTFIRPLSEADLARVGGDEPPTALALVPQPWLAGLPGEQLAGVHLWAVPREALSARPARGSLAEAPGLALARQLLREDQLTGSAVISVRTSPASITPALTSSSLYFPIAASNSVLGITPASESFVALTRTINFIVVSPSS